MEKVLSSTKRLAPFPLSVGRDCFLHPAPPAIRQYLSTHTGELMQLDPRWVATGTDELRALTLSVPKADGDEDSYTDDSAYESQNKHSVRGGFV